MPCEPMELILIALLFVTLAAMAGILYPFKPFGKRRNAFFTLIACFVLIGILADHSDDDSLAESDVNPDREEPLAVPSDPKAKYFVTAIDKRPDGLVEISTRREGPSGTSFAIRLVQCGPLRFAYIAEGDSEKDLVRDPSPELTELVSGSISHVVSKHACELETTSNTPVSNAEPSGTSTEAKSEKRAKLEEDVRKSVDSLRWSDARNRFRTLTVSGLVTDEFKDEIEARMLELVRPLPVTEREANLEGYQFLAAVRPDDSQYNSKIQSYEEAIAAARQRAVNTLRKDEDRVEGVTWYKHPNQPKFINSRSTVYLYIGKRGEAGRPWLRMQVQYTSSDWLFVDKVIAWHDGIKETLISGYFERDNNSKIWEWMDVTPSDLQIEVLKSLANANEAILRFEGDQYYKDVKLSAGDKKAIREVLQAYEILRGGMWRN